MDGFLSMVGPNLRNSGRRLEESTEAAVASPVYPLALVGGRCLARVGELWHRFQNWRRCNRSGARHSTLWCWKRHQWRGALRCHCKKWGPMPLASRCVDALSARFGRLASRCVDALLCRGLPRLRLTTSQGSCFFFPTAAFTIFGFAVTVCVFDFPTIAIFSFASPSPRPPSPLPPRSLWPPLS